MIKIREVIPSNQQRIAILERKLTEIRKTISKFVCVRCGKPKRTRCK